MKIISAMVRSAGSRFKGGIFGTRKRTGPWFRSGLYSGNMRYRLMNVGPWSRFPQLKVTEPRPLSLPLLSGCRKPFGKI